MRIESSVTAVSWIPSEAVEGLPKIPFTIGVVHYDDPPPDVIEDLDALRRGGRVPRGERAAGVRRDSVTTARSQTTATWGEGTSA